MNYLQNFSYYEYFGNKCDCGMSSTHDHGLYCDKPNAQILYQSNGQIRYLCGDCATLRLNVEGWAQVFLELEVDRD